MDVINNKIAIIIPARLGSTRLPRKMLLAETGKPLIQHTYEAVVGHTTANMYNLLDFVAVATGDHEIADVVHGFGGRVIMTDPGCESGTERVRCAAKSLTSEYATIINLQGDEPEISHEHIKALLRDHSGNITTLATAIVTSEEFEAPNTVKVVIGQHSGRALYFSRAPIPYNASGRNLLGLRHLGVYAFKRSILDNLIPESVGGAPTILDKYECLEQLRWLEAGYNISVVSVADAKRGINTMDDYQEFVKRIRRA